MKKLELPQLPYKYDALEPHIDAKTMEIHYTKHHQTYVNKFNEALAKHPEIEGKSVQELLKNLNSIPEDIRTAVRNHGGGHFNHSIWWPMLAKDVELGGEVRGAINKTFGSFDVFKEKFSNAAITLFGSGWAWLVVSNGQLEIIQTPNQDTPVSQGKIPILGIDMWEHAMYLKWGPNKAGYVQAWWNVVNWDNVEQRYQKANKQD